MRIEFVTWLTDELNKRGWHNAELVRRSGMSSAMVSQVMSQQRQAGLEFCVGVAKAFGLPPEDVLRRAGLLPSVPTPDDYDPETQHDLRLITELVGRLPEKQRRQALREMIHAARLVEELGQEPIESETESETVYPESQERWRRG